MSSPGSIIWTVRSESGEAETEAMQGSILEKK